MGFVWHLMVLFSKLHEKNGMKVWKELQNYAGIDHVTAIVCFSKLIFLKRCEVQACAAT